MVIDILAILGVIFANVEAWLPTATTIISFAVCLFWGIAKVKAAANEMKNDTTIKEIRDEQATLRGEVENSIATEKEMIQFMKRVLDDNHKIMRTPTNNDNGNDENNAI